MLDTVIAEKAVNLLQNYQPAVSYLELDQNM